MLKSKLRIYLVLPGSVDGTEPNNENIIKAVNYFTSGKSTSNAEVIYYPDETRT